MTPEERGLLDEVIASPGDDTPRLIYADWLEDAGRARRAEFVRAQIEYATLHQHLLAHAVHRRQPPGCERCNRAHELSDLLQGRLGVPVSGPLGFADDCPHRVFWPGGYPGGDLGTRRVEWDWRRGFVEEMRCTLALWLVHGTALCDLHPIGRVVLLDRYPWIDRHGAVSLDTVMEATWFLGKDGVVSDVSQVLPASIWELLSGHARPQDRRQSVDSRWCKYYEAADEQTARRIAIDALSAACILWARRGAVTLR